METDDKTRTDSPPEGTNNPGLLRRLREKTARYIAQEPDTDLLAPSLQLWQEKSGLALDVLAQSLGLDAEGWNRLALCRKPREDYFAADSDTIADYLGCDAGKLLSFLRRLQVMSGFAAMEEVTATTAPSSDATPLVNGLLLAARDREDEIEELPGDDAEANREP